MSIIQCVQWTQNEAIDVLQQYKSAYQEHLLRKGVHHLIDELSEICKICHKEDLRNNLLHLQNIISMSIVLLDESELFKSELSKSEFSKSELFKSEWTNSEWTKMDIS